MLEACASRLAAAGFAHYEVSAYARPGRQCRHNLNYWSFGDYLGVGAGAHGKLTFPELGAIVRTVQPREPRRYLAAVPGELTRNPVSAVELPFEFMLNALRLTAGFALDTFVARTGLPSSGIAATLERLLARGLLDRTAEGYRPSALGLRFLNDLLVDFMPESPEMSGAFALSIAPAAASRGRLRPLFTGPEGAVGE
jgi:oxygen-independent coproporphyrinogen-3 oxidase